MVRLDVNKHAAMQQSHLEEVEQKVDKSGSRGSESSKKKKNT